MDREGNCFVENWKTTENKNNKRSKLERRVYDTHAHTVHFVVLVVLLTLRSVFELVLYTNFLRCFCLFVSCVQTLTGGVVVDDT